jgi:DNA-binding response OmpR family regulator
VGRARISGQNASRVWRGGNLSMPSATTIVIAREDFSIPGGEEGEEARAPEALERRFFGLLREARPDVVVLDLSRANGAGVGVICKIRRQSGVPILAVCGADGEMAEDYRVAGAAECVAGPVDVLTLNRALQHIVRVNGPGAAQPAPARTGAAEPAVIGFAGLSFRPHQNVVLGPAAARARLTTAESRLLAHFLARPWQAQSRAVLAEALYGRHRPASERAIDVVVNRLRGKLRGVGGEEAADLIKTEFRAGYRFVCQTHSEE